MRSDSGLFEDYYSLRPVAPSAQDAEENVDSWRNCSSIFTTFAEDIGDWSHAAQEKLLNYVWMRKHQYISGTQAKSKIWHLEFLTHILWLSLVSSLWKKQWSTLKPTKHPLDAIVTENHAKGVLLHRAGGQRSSLCSMPQPASDGGQFTLATKWDLLRNCMQEVLWLKELTSYKYVIQVDWSRRK